MGWRTWLVVFSTAFLAVFAQIYTTVSAPASITFTLKDVGNPNLSVWVIQAPLLIQAALNPLLARLSDVVSRKMFITILAFLALAGSLLSAKANRIGILIGGGILYGVALATISIAQTIPAEILPRKYRALSNGISFLGGSTGALTGGFLGGYFCIHPNGWRKIFWVQAGLYALVVIFVFGFYWPVKRFQPAKRSWRKIMWDCDPIGATLFVAGSTGTLMGLNWASGSYRWSDPRVYATLVVGLSVLFAFGLYEWKGRDDGLVAHVFFQAGRNFPLALFAMMVEGWMFYSAINTITPQMHLYLGWAGDSLQISIRQLAYVIPSILVSVPIIRYSTKYKDVKTPNPEWMNAQLAIGFIGGTGQAAPLTLLISIVQFTAPHKFLSNATGMAFSIRAIGGACGSAVLYTIINGRLRSNYAPKVAGAAIGAGLPPDQIPAFMAVMAGGNGPPTLGGLVAVMSTAVPSAKVAAISAAQFASHEMYAKAYRLAWASIIPFAFLALVCVSFLKSVKAFMTDTVEAPLEPERLEGEVEKHWL
ncbi:major facilitator superfamily domain-containing protein [Clohesyomyces aquaticus]|uniref:Major facilitator superfamily domain-containing protein n=1 Tax=Clohesyomyces aquaticus TaxID=1231657 RepID=A0A1Y1ZEZ4_9PLEO|nr:major facilitator superfamily domain-containing protein [Clohesyomyces aquaticus]